jgi:hypothetical protein
MMLACQVARILSKTPATIQPNNFRLTFQKKGAKVSAEDRKRQTEFAKAHRAAAMGGMKYMTVVDINGNVLKEPELKATAIRNPNLRKADAQHGRTRNSGNAVHSRREGVEESANGGGASTPTNRKGRRPKQ